MARNSKNAKQHQLAREYTALHLKGQRGPKQTQKKHTKVKCWYKDRQAYYRRNEKTSARSTKGVANAAE